MKQRLQGHFWDKLCLFATKDKTGIVHSEETIFKMKSLYDVDTANVVSDCGEIIRNEILNFKNPFPNM